MKLWILHKCCDLVSPPDCHSMNNYSVHILRFPIRTQLKTLGASSLQLEKQIRISKQGHHTGDLVAVDHTFLSAELERTHDLSTGDAGEERKSGARSQLGRRRGKGTWAIDQLIDLCLAGPRWACMLCLNHSEICGLMAHPTWIARLGCQDRGASGVPRRNLGVSRLYLLYTYKVQEIVTRCPVLPAGTTWVRPCKGWLDRPEVVENGCTDSIQRIVEEALFWTRIWSSCFGY